jgi:hypothetical protein
MRSDELASQLRDRLRAKGLVPGMDLDAVPDEVIIESYVTCSGCGERLVSETALPGLIADARDVDDWFDRWPPHPRSEP